MMNRSFLAFLVVFGACDRDHQLGLVDPDVKADGSISTIEPSTSPDALGSGVQGIVGNDWDAAGPLDNVQSWTGYIENYKFTSGSDVIKFTFGIDGTGQVVGKVYLGNGTPPPPATDPNVGYPPGYFDSYDVSAHGHLEEGFVYSMIGAVYSSRRLQFSFEGSELWAGWCALQTPIPGSSFCLPNWGGGMLGYPSSCGQTDPTGKVVPVDCGKFQLCYRELMCNCSMYACSVNPTDRYSFDLVVSDSDASGGTTGFTMGQSAHFTKDP